MKLEDVLEKIEEVGFRRGMKNADIQALKESIKHLDKKVGKK
jgi:hypothetical protein